MSHNCDKKNCPSLSQHNLEQANKTIRKNGERMLEAVLNHAEPDYHQRFRETVGSVYVRNLLGRYVNQTEEILAFIDEVYDQGRRDGGNERMELCSEHQENARLNERAALIEKVEGMKTTDDHKGSEVNCRDCIRDGALDDLLTHLRGRGEASM